MPRTAGAAIFGPMTEGAVITGSPVLQPRTLSDAEAFCERLLPRVSRTFAISIRLLPGQLGRSVLCAYLLCRIADTIEDEHDRSADDKARLLDAMLVAFRGFAEANAFQSLCAKVTGDPAHAELVHGAADVFTLWRDLPGQSREHVQRWVGEMVRGMRAIVLAHPQGVRLQTLDDYREYCYYVAGTVGYMLTDLWRAHSPAVNDNVYDALKTKARAFGEALQTVNILKDVAVDAERENNIYIPEQLLRSHGSSHATILSPAHETANHAALAVLIQLAWKNLDEARDYLLLVPRRAFAVRVFCVLPLLYAYATLRELTKSRAMLRSAGNVKISRREVRTLMVAGIALACSNAGIAWLVQRVRRS
jgi:farnesyl-diphosphate farnesyltransferase